MHTNRRVSRPRLAWAVAATVVAAGSTAALALTGPSSSNTPYLVPSIAGITMTSILTVGDSVNLKPDGTPYRMVGIPDGLGAFDNEDGTFTVLMNHELGDTQGIVRAHGAKGAFVSKWVIDTSTLEVLNGKDLIEDIGVFDGVGWDFTQTIALRRLCSADLPAPSAFHHGSRGYDGRLFMNGEETGAEGFAYAHAMDGKSYRLPWLGRMSYENVVANPGTGKATIVACTDDDAAGQIYIYAGEKKSGGSSPVERAGLMNGEVWGVKVQGVAFEDAGAGIPSDTKFECYDFGDVSGMTGAALQTASRAAGVTEFNRPEDGVWDPKHPDDFYFVTTASFTGNSRLWRLRFKDASRPDKGGRIDMLLDGSEGQHMFDNVTMNRHGELFLQEDPGGQNHLAKIWRYDTGSDTLVEVAQHDPARFAPGAAGFLTIDEESSGIIDVSDILGEGSYLLDVQAHYGLDAELVQGGQLLLLEVEREKKGKKGEHGHGGCGD